MSEITGVENGHFESKPRNNLQPKTKCIYMDEALSKIKFGIYNYALIFMSGIILTAVFAETCGVSYIIPVSECDLNLTAGRKGILSSIPFVGMIFGSHLWGYLADTIGRRRTILPTLLMAFLLSSLSSLMKNFYLFVILRFFNGFFISGSSVVIYVYLGEFHDSVHRTRSIVSSAIILGVGCLLLPLIAWLIINQDWQFDIPFIDVVYKPWRLFLVISSLLELLAFIILLFLSESPKFVLGQGNNQQAYEILQNINHVNNGTEFEKFDLIEEPESIENRQRILKCKESRFPLIKSIWIQTAPLFEGPYLYSTVLICLCQFGIMSTSNGFFMFVADIFNKMASNLDSFVEQRMSMCEAINMKPINQTTQELEGAICNTQLEIATIRQEFVLECIFSLGSALVSLLVNKLGKFPILFTILIVCGANGIVCMLVDLPVVQICAFITLVSCSLAISIVNAATIDLYPTAQRAMALCISQIFGQLGCVLGANIAALLLYSHCETVFYLSGSTVMAVGILTFFIPNIHQKSERRKTMMSIAPRVSVLSVHATK